MKTPEGTWFNQPTLHDSEVIALAYPANHTQNDWRAVGGKLFVTNQRIIFIPNKADHNFGGNSVEVTHEQVSSIFVKERSISIMELFSGGLRDRLGIRLADGTEHLFVVSKLSDTQSDIEGTMSDE